MEQKNVQTRQQILALEQQQAEVEATKQRIGDRFELQKALLPYEHLLPERLRGRNERIDEPLAREPARRTA